MQFLFNLVSVAVRTVLKLVVLAAALVFILSLLCVALVSLVFVLLKALLTGRKPAVLTTFSRFAQASQQFRSGEWPAHAGAGFGHAAPGDVTDVQAREVHRDKELPYAPSQDKP